MAYEENARKARQSGQITFFAWLAAFLLVTIAVCVALRDPLPAMLMVPISLAVSWRLKVNAQDSRKIDATHEEATALIATNPAHHFAVYHLEGPCEGSLREATPTIQRHLPRRHVGSRHQQPQCSTIPP